MRRGDEIEITLEKFADRGKSLARLDGYVVFVAGAMPGDTVRARIRKRKKKFAEAQLLDVVSPSPLRIDPKCDYFGTCGGCKWQHVRYQAQLDAKRQSVEEALRFTGGFPDVTALPTIGADPTYFYRNKMEFSFSTKRWLMDHEIEGGEIKDKSFALGLHVNFLKVVDLKMCYLQSEWSARLVNDFRVLAREHDWAPWDIKQHVGYLRHLVVRRGEFTGERMVNLVTYGYDEERIAIVADFLRERFPEVTTFVNTINTSWAQTAFGEEVRTIYGPGVIHDTIGPYRFEIASNAFFQTNTRQAEVLYNVARDFAELQPTDVLYDLYCGAGTISLFVSGHVQRVVGVELVEEAVVNARRNAVANGVDNCTFIAGDLMRLFTPEFVRKHGRPDVLIVDPPRAGMHPKVVKQIAALRPERFVYVSCNPQTQARDLADLRDMYDVEAAQPVDLFPHTYHIETVAKLRLRNP